MISRAGICTAVSAVILGIIASGLTGCAVPEQRTDQSANRGQGPTAYHGLCRCPQPVHYSDAEIKAISAALRALPDNNPLQQAMSDYEDERDNLRICLGR